MSAGDASRLVEQSLVGVRVLEWGQGVAARYATRMLADFGATVARIVAPGNTASPRETNGEVAAFFDHGKSQVALDPASESGRLELLRHAAIVDLLIEDFSPGTRARWQLQPDVVSRANPRLVQVSVTPFGQTGPFRDFRASDLEISYLSGLAYLTPRDIAPDPAQPTPPLRMPGSLVSIYSGASAAAAALVALFGREHGHPGCSVDVSMLESLIPTLRREIALYQYEGTIASRFMRVWRLAPWGVKRCRDGYVFLQVVEKHHWQGLVDMMGGPDWAQDAKYLDPDYRFEHRADIEARIAPWLLTQAKAQFSWESQRRGLPFAPVNELGDIARIPQLHHRGFFRAANAPDGRPCVVPGPPFAFRSAPVDAFVPGRGVARIETTTKTRGPLRSLRVLDFGHVWAGPYCAALLADMGAEVIKVESAHRLDVHRRQGPYAQRKQGINRSGVWNAQNRGKRSVTLNLSTERGRDLARALVATADVVIENFAPGVMARLGLGYEALAAAKPDLVMASLSAFGQEGPQSSYVGYGPSLDAWAGLDALTAYEHGEPNALGGIFPDTGSALHAAAGILAALHRRDRTGAGCYIDLSELEVSVLLLADLVARSLGGESIRACGNGDGEHCPQGGYRCAGDDRWIALSIVDAASWSGLCALLDRIEWSNDPALRSAGGRRNRAAEIDAAIGDWAASREPAQAMLELQQRGVPAGVAHDAKSLLADAHLRERRFFVDLTHPEVGIHPVYAPIWRIGGEEASIDRPAPMLGGDNDYVLRELLGLPDGEFDALVAAKVVY